MYVKNLVQLWLLFQYHTESSTEEPKTIFLSPYGNGGSNFTQTAPKFKHATTQAIQSGNFDISFLAKWTAAYIILYDEYFYKYAIYMERV